MFPRKQPSEIRSVFTDIDKMKSLQCGFNKSNSISFFPVDKICPQTDFYFHFQRVSIVAVSEEHAFLNKKNANKSFTFQ